MGRTGKWQNFQARVPPWERICRGPYDRSIVNCSESRVNIDESANVKKIATGH